MIVTPFTKFDKIIRMRDVAFFIDFSNLFINRRIRELQNSGDFLITHPLKLQKHKLALWFAKKLIGFIKQ